jgi:hypothetical protein
VTDTRADVDAGPATGATIEHHDPAAVTERPADPCEGEHDEAIATRLSRSPMTIKHGLLLSLIAVSLSPAASIADAPVARVAAPTCSDYPNQAAAQEAAVTRDPDGDGIYCESLPCPCSDAAGGDGRGSDGTTDECAKPDAVQRLVFSLSKYPNVRRHFRGALRRGWPRLLVLNRPGADDRRDRLLEGIPTRDGFDRDEYPPAVGRGKGAGLERGSEPCGWKADVRYVPSSENRSHGASLGAKLADFCNGTRFQYVFQ